MEDSPDFPTADEIARFLDGTIKHAWHIEFYLSRLQVGRSDIQRPHDLVGTGNKFEWDAIRGFAMQYRNRPDAFENFVKPSLDFHRQQYHHCAWNEFNPQSSTDAMRLGAVDAVCSLLEPRGYQGGCHSFDAIYDIAEKNPIHKVAWMQIMIHEMRKIERPVIEATMFGVSPDGVGAEARDIMEGRAQDALNMLDHNFGCGNAVRAALRRLYAVAA